MASKRDDNRQVLPDNPLLSFNSYMSYFTVKIGRAYQSQNGEFQSNVGPEGHANPENFTILDTRGQDLNATGQAQRPNPHPQLSVKHFDIMHFFTHNAEATFGLDSTLRIFERGSVSYFQQIGRVMIELGVTSVSELVLWVGVGIWGWEDGNSGADSGWNSFPISQKWFPMNIRKIDVNITASGAEYTHWLKGWPYYRSVDKQSQHINNIVTTGVTLNDHLLDLMSKAKNNSLKTRKEARVAKDSPLGQKSENFKTIDYDFTLEAGFPGVRISKDARVVSDTITQNTGGKIDVHSGGAGGETTIVNHIKEILAHCPSISKALSEQKSFFKIIPRTELNEKEEKINYAIIPYRLDGKGLLPLKRFTYFFGGTNEEVISFELSIDGLFRVIPNAIARSSRNAKEADTAENSSAQQAKSRQAGAAGNATINPNQGQADTDDEKVTSVSRVGQKTGGAFPVNKNKTNSFYRNNTLESQRMNLNLLEQVETYAGSKLLEGGFKIIGDPNLILDESTIRALKERNPPAPIESAINYVTFDIGTPNPEFPEIPDTDNFIFNGYYMIRTLKSVWDEQGKFTQELDVFWRSDLADMARGKEEAPDKSVPKAPIPGVPTPPSFTDAAGRVKGEAGKIIPNPSVATNPLDAGLDNYGNIKDGAAADIGAAGKHEYPGITRRLRPGELSPGGQTQAEIDRSDEIWRAINTGERLQRDSSNNIIVDKDGVPILSAPLK